MKITSQIMKPSDLAQEGVMDFLLTAFRTVTMSNPIGIASSFISQLRAEKAYIVMGFEDGVPTAVVVAGVYEPGWEPPSANVLLVENHGRPETLQSVLTTLAGRLKQRGIEVVFARNILMHREKAVQRRYRSFGDVRPVGTLYQLDLRS